MSDPPKDAKGIFLAALDISDAAERAAFLERSCDGDRSLRQRVEDLLRAYGQSEGPLEKLAADLAPTQLGEPIREQVGATIGPYKLMEQIGEGGFGLVFVAEQQKPIQRKVALKIIKPGMDTRDVIARFEAERQALALMDHPNIARVLDAGTTGSGRPYFVMELVRGIPITDYCDQTQLTPRERLELFVPVCNAIQHAHLKGIIHRDIKPSNVLVTLHDDRPVVKVIDFGVAKALHQHLTEKTVYTRFAQMIGTPLYMSPEQAQMSGLDIDTRTDVYSLGVLLYELLTGTTPFNKERLAKAAYDELLKIIREEEPPKPSLRLSQSGDALPSIAAQRKTEPARLSKMFHGDVDWIAMKALEKDRARRYETANAFSADVLRYLNDEPVEASPPSAAYRLRKFARKHRKSVIALAAIAAVLVLGILGTTWGLFRARRAEHASEIAERAARQSKRKAVNALSGKEEALAAEAAQRDRAERQLAEGLLRPIGFSLNLDLPELRSFVDWSAIKESPLKIRVLEIALDNPETALRVARRAERVIQACVALSPTRRAQAMKLVSAKQRDRTADPRIRVAACWLALELGSTDLPAWAESCSYLSQRKNEPGYTLLEFVSYSVRCSNLQQIAQMNPDRLIAMLEGPIHEAPIPYDAWRRLCLAFQELAPRLEPAQAKRVWDAVIANGHRWNTFTVGVDLELPGLLEALALRLGPAQFKTAAVGLLAVLEKSADPLQLYVANYGIMVLASRLETTQSKRVADAVVAFLRKSTKTYALAAATHGLCALAPHLESAQANRACDAVVANLNIKSPDDVFKALAPRLEPLQLKRFADTLIGILEKSSNNRALIAASGGLQALGPRMEPVQRTRAEDALVAILQRANDFAVYGAASRCLGVLARQLEPVQVTRATDALLALVARSHVGFSGLEALAPRLEPGQAKRVWDVLIANPDMSIAFGLSEFLKTLVARLEPSQLSRAADACIAILEKSTDLNALSVAAAGLTAMGPRLDRTQVKRIGDAAIGLLEKSHEYQILALAAVTVRTLAPRLGPAQRKRAGNALIVILEKSTDVYVVNAAEADDGLAALAPWLEPAQVKRAADALIASPEKAKLMDVGLRGAVAWEAAFVALATHLERASRDKLSTAAAAAVLDYRSSDFPEVTEMDLDPTQYKYSQYFAYSYAVARSTSSSRLLAKLLSHPACVVAERDVLLKRFEELVFYDGKAVLLKPTAGDWKKPADGQPPPRRFQNLSDAAAWIQQNWPDFDLETNCPVSWRDSH